MPSSAYQLLVGFKAVMPAPGWGFNFVDNTLVGIGSPIIGFGKYQLISGGVAGFPLPSLNQIMSAWPNMM